MLWLEFYLLSKREREIPSIYAIIQLALFSLSLLFFFFFFFYLVSPFEIASYIYNPVHASPVLWHELIVDIVFFLILWHPNVQHFSRSKKAVFWPVCDQWHVLSEPYLQLFRDYTALVVLAVYRKKPKHFAMESCISCLCSSANSVALFQQQYKSKRPKHIHLKKKKKTTNSQ